MRKGLLLGAGFSCDLGMPLTAELTDVFLKLFSERNARQFADVLSANEPFTKERPINRSAIHEGVDLLLRYKRDNGNNYEGLLTKLDALGELPGKSQSDRDSYHYLFSVFYNLLHAVLVAYQNASYETLYERNRRWFSKLENLLSTEETWVFTLNHDLYFECLAIDLRIPVTYGDVGRIVFPVSNLEASDEIRLTCSQRSRLDKKGVGWFAGRRGVNLVRLHGGLAELEYKDGALICNPSLELVRSSDLIREFNRIESMGYYHEGQRAPSGRMRVVTGIDGTVDIIGRSMLTGGRKYSKTTNNKKGEEKLKLLDDVLLELDELTIVGYSFGDAHVNYRVSNAMVRNPALKIRIVDPASNWRPAFLEQFDYDARVRGALCGAAQWMTYTGEGKWDQAQIEALKDPESVRAEIRRKVEAHLPK